MMIEIVFAYKMTAYLLVYMYTCMKPHVEPEWDYQPGGSRVGTGAEVTPQGAKITL